MTNFEQNFGDFTVEGGRKSKNTPILFAVGVFVVLAGLAMTINAPSFL